ncbi:uncharacterized protein LOC132556569 [Ylistrum balloti]|uniref:uncharacterized protein LOC132556569 n=1 Tax=Ylistrum balloti TaxID=509963 RepID=UPI00290595EF|nr:uncharacterized protein LOC132556569 [Ylistrum balloti]
MLGFYFRIVLCQLMLGRLSSMSLNDGNKTATISNTTNLLYQFFLLCGPEYFCHPEKLTFGFDIIKTRRTEICADCRCDRDCTTDGNCCVDVIFSLPLPVCVDSSIADGQVFHLSNDVFMTNSCLSNTVNDTWRGSCETNDIVFKAGRVEFPPVTSRRYRQTFKNKFCAECNGVFDYNEWSLSMTCPELTDFNFYSSFDEIFEKVDSEDCGVGFSTIDDDMHKCDRDFVDVLSRSKCNVTGAWVTYDQDIDLACNSIYSLRHGLYTNIFCFMCNPPAYNDNVISSCNVTGLWNQRMDSLERACEVHAKSPNTVPYKNIFCFLCNRNNSHSSPYFDVYTDKMTEDIHFRSSNGKLTFVYKFLFTSYNVDYYDTIVSSTQTQNSGKSEKGATDKWSNSRWNSVQNVSADSFLPWSIDMQCEEDLNLRYHTTMYDVINFAKRIGCILETSSKGVSRRRLLSCYPGKVLDGSECFPLLRTTTRLKYILAFSLEGTIDSTKQTLFADTRLSVLSEIKKRLSLEELYIISFHIMSNISCDINNLTESKGVHLLIQTTFTIVKVVERLQTEQTLLNLIKQNFVISEVSFISRPASEAYLLPSVPGSNFNGYCVQKVLQAYKSWITLPSIRAILVSEVLTCRHVVLDPEEYSIKLETLELTLKYTSKKFHQDKFLRMPDHSVQLCLNDYLEILDEYTASTKDDTFRQALSVTTLVCTAASLLFLFITFCTYSLFRAMRSVPGVNNMSLVFAMFFSQAFFQFGFDKTSHASLCKSIGVFTHYFWLATFACMNICTYHMYSVFATSTLTARHRNVRKTITTYILYSYGTPALVVLVNIITSYVISRVDDVNSGFTEIGYGGGSCFISNKVSLYVTFLAPVVLICIINLFMFIRVAIQIGSTPKVESTKAQRLDFVIYVKLFSITGITWIFLIIDSFFPLSVFSFIVTFLTGFQGVAIFSSFVWNNRVFSLYKALCLKRNNTSSSKYSTQSVEVVSSSM